MLALPALVSIPSPWSHAGPTYHVAAPAVIIGRCLQLQGAAGFGLGFQVNPKPPLNPITSWSAAEAGLRAALLGSVVRSRAAFLLQHSAYCTALQGQSNSLILETT
jgi:hypothetical protein